MARSKLDRLMERGDEAIARARAAVEWFRQLRTRNQAAHQHSHDTLCEWRDDNAGAQDLVNGSWEPPRSEDASLTRRQNT